MRNDEGAILIRLSIAKNKVKFQEAVFSNDIVRSISHPETYREFENGIRANFMYFPIMKSDERVDQPIPKKEISLGLALVPMIAMGAMIGVLHLWLGVDLKFVLLLSAIVAGITATYYGIRFNVLLTDFAENIKKAVPAILILIAIGGIVGSWMYSGTVPYLIYYGLKFLNPSFVLVSAFLVTAIVSTFTGTSWGSAATAGVAFIGIGHSLGVPLEMVAGAVLSGAFFGDKISPISDTTNICAMASEITVYQHIRGMLLNVSISGLITAIFFLILGLTLTTQTGDYQAVDNLLLELETSYNLNIFMLLPAVVVLVGGFKGYNPVVVMVGSSLMALAIGMISNGFTMPDAALSMISGFSTTMLGEGDYSASLSILLNRGGFEGMMTGAVLFCILAIAFGSFMQSSGSLDLIMKALLRAIKSTFGLIAAAFVAGAALNGLSGSGVFAILTTGQLFRGPFKERKVPATVLSRSMENSMTLLESLLPWHVTAIYMTATLGVSTLDYAPYAIFNITGIILFFALVGIDIKRKKY
jgi:NhaC family Na+:H+ antiporter